MKRAGISELAVARPIAIIRAAFPGEVTPSW
jgi:hypothetical protein